MTGDYWLGLATVPAAIVACGLALLALRALLRAGAALAVTTGRLLPETAHRRRVALAAGVYAARRVWFLGAGNLGVVVLTGQDPDERILAVERLGPPVTLRSFLPPDDHV